MLELKHISYAVTEAGAEQAILKDVSVTIPDGKLIVFTGPNGGGKTTLAKIIMGLVTPTGGQILYNGQDITGMSITERARLGVSYGFQQPPVSRKYAACRRFACASSSDARRRMSRRPSADGARAARAR